jgi:Domain of unknown function (DUF397)
MKAVWVRSSLSFSNGNCVEVAALPGDSVAVRNSRDPDGPVLKFTQGEWDAFLGGARLGEFDRFGSMAYDPGAASASGTDMMAVTGHSSRARPRTHGFRI